jgi:hypothetical protein
MIVLTYRGRFLIIEPCVNMEDMEELHLILACRVIASILRSQPDNTVHTYVQMCYYVVCRTTEYLAVLSVILMCNTTEYCRGPGITVFCTYVDYLIV